MMLRGMKSIEAKERWQALIAEQEGSGQNIRRFAEERGISAWTMYDWRRRLGLSGRRRKPRPADSADRGASNGSLVAVDIVGAEDVPPAASEDGYWVEIGEELRILVPRGFDGTELSRLVSALRCSC